MANSAQFYEQMAARTAEQITGSYQEWTAFLATAARLYKYPYHEQLMIYAQRPEATACAEYDFWNKRMRRYVRRGSRGIALVDSSGEKPSLRYVFDVADTGGGDNARRPYLWQLQDEHMGTVLRALEARYEVSGGDGLEYQLELVADRLVKDYWEDHQRDILSIVDGSFLEDYDDYNVEVAFRNAASTSITYTLMARCGLDPEQYFGHEDFLSVFDWNTPAAVSALGTAVSEVSEQVLRHIEVTIKRYEREKITERSQNHGERADLHTERGLSDPGPEADGGAGGGTAGQVREDAQAVSEGAPAHPVSEAGAGGEAVPAPAGDRRDSPPEAVRDDAADGEGGGRDGDVESSRPDEVGGPDEHPESTGGGDHPERAGVQLNGQEQQLTLFPSEQEQRQSIAEAESVETPSAFSISDEEWDAELRRGSGNLDGKLRIYALFLGMPDTRATIAFLKQEYGSFYSHSQTYRDGSHGTVIYTAKGIEFRRYQPSGSIHIPWSRAAARLKELVSAQAYLTPVEQGRWDGIVRGFQQHGEPLPPPVARVTYPPPMQAEQLTLDALTTPPAAETVSPPPFHEKYLPEILRHEDGSATWEALTKFFTEHPEEHLRVSYLRLRFGEVLHQYPASDGTTIGFRGFPDQLHVWEGNYLNPAAITRLTWGEVCLLAEKEIARDAERPIPSHEAEAGADEARTPDSPEARITDRHRALTQADIDAALRDWNGDMESKRAVVRYMKEHGREKDTAAWLQQEYGDSLPAFPVTADGAAGDVPWPKVQRRIAQLIQRDEFFTEQERDEFEDIDPMEIRERLAERGIVDGKVVDPEKLGSDPFIRQVMADVEQITGGNEPEAYTSPAGRIYHPGDAVDAFFDDESTVVRMILDHVDEDYIWYTMPSVPGQEPVQMRREIFEKYLDNGEFRPVPAPMPEKAPELGPSPTVREIYEHYLPIVREKVLSDQAYRNAVQNSDRENTMLEGEEAIKRAVLSIEDSNFMRLYYVLTGFHNSLHQTVLEETYAALTEPAQPDLSGQPVSRDGDTITIGAGEPTHEVDLAVSDEEWTEIQEAIPEDGAVPGVITIDGKPRDPLSSAYGAGDFVYLEDKEYKITSLERGQVELLDPTLDYPVYRMETRENFERLLRQDQRNGPITEFLPADLERFDQDLREVLASGLLTDRDKDYVSRWLRNGEGNAKLSQRLSAQFAGRVETMNLVTGETADCRATTTGLEVEIIRDDDKILATVSASWKELAAVLRALYQQELDGFSHTPVQREAVCLTGTPAYQVGDHVVLPAPDQEISGTIGYIGEQEVRIDTGPYAWSNQTVSRSQFEEWLRRDERNAELFQPEVQETAEPAYTTQTTAVYPGDKNHLPYDVVVQTIRTGEPERPGPGPSMPPAGNFHITDDHLGEGGPKEKYRRNVEAIRTLKAIEVEGRGATEAEQEVLSRYVGWGGLPQVFDQDKEDWHTEYAELKGVLDESEYAAARSSTLNAHYTSPTVIKAVYEALGNFGFQKGNILEPSCGVGNFFGLLPEAMAGSQLYGVELDSITGRIASLLYPEARIAVRGFEKVHFPNSFFDVAVGNVPFGQYPVNDPAYNKLGFHIHNYFFAKALDQVRPGGIVAFLTSRYTLDAKDEKVRRYLAQRAELLGAVRLPNNAFKANAGTEVVSDIIFLQKRDHLIDIVPDWVRTRETAEGFTINRYFTAYPEMVLGRAASQSTQYGHQDYTVLPIEGADLAQQLHEAVGRIHGQIPAVELPELGDEEEPASEAAIPADPNVKNYSYTVVEGEVYFRENSIMVKPRLNATATARVIGMVELRDCVNRLIDLQMDDADALAIQAEQKKLNTLYDAFTARFGLISSRGNELAFSDDNSYYLLSSLEVLDEDGNLQRKADMFTKRTIQPHRAVTHVDTASEALAISISEKARVDMPYMAQLTGKTEAELAAELRGVIFRVPNETDGAGGPQYAAADGYLSGNVRQKLAEAQRAADADPMYQDNVEALRQALPKDLDASEIDLRLGATWIDQKYIQQFMYETLQTPGYLQGRIRVLYSQFTVEWSVTSKTSIPYDDVAAYMNFGTERASAYRILEDTLNLRDVRIYDTIRDGDTERRVLNQKETTLAQQKQQALKDAFKDWIWKDPQRRQELVRSYNDRFNAIRPREYDGKHIVFTGMNPEITLREHQRNAIAHILYGKNTLLAHEVGAGKTFEMVAAAMESKRLGLCRKSLFVVPNHLVEQWASEILRLYPAANILVTTKKDFEARNRKRFCAKIATGDYDAVIMGHSQFERLPVSMARRERLIQEQIAEMEDGIAELEASGAERYTIKQLERMKKSLTVCLEKLHTTARKDSVVTFEQLGVDRLFVDEAHSYKNLFLYTKMRNVAGLSTSDAQKSSDMLLKCRYINEITGGKGVVFATGTPVSNSMTELYTMQRYLQVDLLEKTHLSHFDNWASIFGETVTAIELAPEGTGYRARTRFARFFNLPELMSMFKETADIKTADQLNLPTPKAVYHVEKAEPSEHQKAMVQDLSERASKVHAGIDPHIDNMLKITSDGRKLGLDQRLINPMLPDNPDSKVNRCVNNILRIWREGQTDRLTQLVFCDISTPKSKVAAQRDRSAMAVGDKIVGGADLHALVDTLDDVKPDAPFSVYEDIRDKLIAGGVPAHEIAFIHDANTDARKKELFSKVRRGQVRVLMGSTFKMGAGMNVQDRLIALHDLDCPWRPGDLEQRKGRIVRQGNQNQEVHIYRYVTEGTFDSYLWQTVENKQKFISQIMTSKSPVRSCEDVDETALSYAEIKALCAGNPLIREKMDLDIDVSRLRILKADHQSKQFQMEDNVLRHFPEQIKECEGFIAGFQKDMETLAAHPHPIVTRGGEDGKAVEVEKGFAGMVVRGDTLTDKDNAGAALLGTCKEVKTPELTEIGSYRGFTMFLSVENFGSDFILTLKGEMSHRTKLGLDARGNLLRIDNTLADMHSRMEGVQVRLSNLREQLAAAKKELGKPFPQEAELAAKSARLAELNAQLDMGAQRKPTSQEQEIAKSTRPSVLEGLKRPVPPRAAEKKAKHHEEVR